MEDLHKLARKDYTLEPRVAKLEVGLDRLTEDLKDLATVVRQQGKSVEAEIQKLVVAVTQAQGPRKTDWGVLIAAAGLFLAIGGAAFWPLNQQVQELKISQTANHQLIVEHQKMDNHPVGTALVQRLEEQLKLHIQQNVKDISDHIINEQKDFEFMRKCFQERLESERVYYEGKIRNIQAELEGIQAKNDLYIDKLFGRIQVLEKEHIKQADTERAELMLWRQKAMGLTVPDSYVPLVPRDMGVNNNDNK